MEAPQSEKKTMESNVLYLGRRRRTDVVDSVLDDTYNEWERLPPPIHPCGVPETTRLCVYLENLLLVDGFHDISLGLGVLC